MRQNKCPTSEDAVPPNRRTIREEAKIPCYAC